MDRIENQSKTVFFRKQIRHETEVKKLEKIFHDALLFDEKEYIYDYLRFLYKNDMPFEESEYFEYLFRTNNDLTILGKQQVREFLDDYDMKNNYLESLLYEMPISSSLINVNDNSIFKNKCMDFSFFNSIKYLVHSMNDEDMKSKILEIADVNPYLAAVCYKTSEENEILKQALLCRLDLMQKKMLLTHIMLALAYWELGQMAQCRYYMEGCYGNRSEKKGYLYFDAEWSYIEQSWVDEYEKMVLEYSLKTFAKHTRFISRYRENVNMPMENLIQSSKKYLKTLHKGELDKEFYEIVEKEGLYGKFDEMNLKFNRHLEEMMVRAMRNGISNKTKLDFLVKTIAIFLWRGVITPEYVKHKLDTKQNRRRRIDFCARIKQMLEDYKAYSIGFDRSLVSKEKLSFWDVEKNGIDKPYAFYAKGDMEFWWKDAEGNSWKCAIRNLNDYLI